MNRLSLNRCPMTAGCGELRGRARRDERAEAVERPLWRRRLQEEAAADVLLVETMDAYLQVGGALAEKRRRRGDLWELFTVEQRQRDRLDGDEGQKGLWGANEELEQI